MATYLRLSDLVDVIGAAMVLRLLDDNKDGAADVGAVEHVLTSAEREVQGYTSGKLPMQALLADAEATDHLRSIAIHVAVELAYRRRPEFITRDGTPYHGPYSETLAKLKLIAANKYQITVQGVPASPATSGGFVAGPTRVTSSGVVALPPGPGAFTGGFGSF